MLRCNISQRVPQHPVVSVKSGHVFERSLAIKYIEEHGRCPMTGEPLRVEDLIPVHGATPDATSVAASGSLGAASVPTLLERLQAEWEGVALEQFTLRQQLAQMQQELAHALQQYGAACRVIARLSKDLAVARGEDTSEATANGQANEEAAVVVPASVQREIDVVEAAERKSRKQRKAAAANAPVPQSMSEVAQWAAGSTAALHVATSADGAGVFASQVSGDHAVVRYSLSNHAEEARGVGHTQAVHTIVSLPEVTLSAAEDHTVRVWKSSAPSELHCASTLRYATGVAAMSQRTVGGAFILCGAPDGSLYLSDVEHGTHLVSTAPLVRGPNGGLTCVELHLYSSLALVAVGPADVQLWDTRSMTPNTVIALPHGDSRKGMHVSSASFSADCVSLAAGLSDGSAYVWDLRQVSAPVAVLPASAQGIPATVRYAPDGRSFAVAGAGLSLYHVAAAGAAFEPVATVEALDAAVTDLSWSVDGAGVVSGSADGAVRLYSTAA